MTIEMKPKKQKKSLDGPHDSEPKQKKVKFSAKPDVEISEKSDLFFLAFLSVLSFPQTHSVKIYEVNGDSFSPEI